MVEPGDVAVRFIVKLLHSAQCFYLGSVATTRPDRCHCRSIWPEKCGVGSQVTLLVLPACGLRSWHPTIFDMELKNQTSSNGKYHSLLDVYGNQKTSIA
jgi:hypothetical protein